MVSCHIQHEDLVPAIQSLEDYFREGGTSIIQAAFKHTYFVHPDAVLTKTPYFPERARRSREHYAGIDKGDRTIWKAGDGREIILDDNSRAQMAWERYTGHRLLRKSGYECATSGEIPITPTHSPPVGTCAICLSGQVC